MIQGYVLAIHAGCEEILPERFTSEEETERLEALGQSLLAGEAVLGSGGGALDAVEAAVRLLEDSPCFNAGRGSVFTEEGTNEMDAAIMSGTGLRAGAVAGTTTIQNPVAAARQVMEASGHVLLVGAGAERFAEERGLERADPSSFRTSRRWEEYLRAREGERLFSERTGEYGTVGAVALDGKGGLAAASSTGGTTNKKHGRVGDSPVIGAGVYADDATCAVSCTGQGEYFIRLVAAHRVSLLMGLRGLGLEEAAAETLDRIRELGGEGGLIAVDHSGGVALPFVTQGMFRGLVREGQGPRVAMYGPPGSW